MGIQGLLPLLKSIHKPCNLKKFAGQTIAVDAYGWLHRGTVACAMELAMGRPTRKFVDFAMHRVRMLQHFGVVPFLVFDGDYLPSKAATESDRAKRREESRRLGFELLNAGKTAAAHLELQKAIDVTPEMAGQLIDELKKIGIQYIVAPYEADAQMVYLERKGLVSAILSEDSDLLVFGAKCLLTKLDNYGNCIEINKNDFCACREINLTGWSDTEFRRMAILSGCDYLTNINNMGLKTAYRMVRKYKTIEKVLQMLRFDGKYSVPKGYLEAFYEAELTFLHQRVYCPMLNSLVFHTEPDLPIDEQSMPYIGAYVESEVARLVAIGELNPITKQPIIKEERPRMVTPRSPWMPARQQPRRAATSDDLKKGVSLEQFFKPRRVPLAELDPNCFTPSPTQQDALLRNSGPWPAELVPRPYLHRFNTESDQQLPQSAPPATNRLPLLRAGTTVLQTRPAKRGRLCSDDILEGTLGGAGNASVGRSRFFDSFMTDRNPSLTKSTRTKRSKQEDITIFSDDSIEEALLSLPDCGVWHKAKPKKGESFAIFGEDEVKLGSIEQPMKSSSSVEGASQTTNLTDVSQSTAQEVSETTNLTGISQSTAPSLTQSSSFGSTADEPHTPIDNPLGFNSLRERFAFNGAPASSAGNASHSTNLTDIPQRIAPSPAQSFSLGSTANESPAPGASPLTFNALREKFKFNGAPASSLKRHASNMHTPPSSLRPSRIPIAAKQEHSSIHTAVSTKLQTSTPLQRLGAKARNHSLMPPPTPPYTPTPVTTKSNSAAQQRTATLPKPQGSRGVPFPEIFGSSELMLELDPADIPLPVSPRKNPPDDHNILAASVVKAEGEGSEDFIVHDSEDELDAEEGGILSFTK